MFQRPLPVSSLAKIPRQSRSTEMVHAILDAAILVLEREGVVHFTTNRVAEVAGISIGSLYQYFTNKEMLIVGVVERAVLDTEALMRATWAGARELPPDELLMLLLRALIADLVPYRNLLREVLSATPIAGTGGVWTLLETRVVDMLRAWFTTQSDRYRLDGGSSVLWVIANVLIYSLLRWLTEMHEAVPEDVFVESIVSMVMTPLRPVGS